MWVEVASCLDQNLRQKFIRSLFSVWSENRQWLSMKNRETTRKNYVLRRGILIIRGGSLTEFDSETVFDLKPQISHRLVKAAMFTRIGTMINLHEFGARTPDILNSEERERLAFLNDQLTVDPKSVDYDEILDEAAFQEAEIELRELVENIFHRIPQIEPGMSAADLAADTNTSKDFIEEMFRKPEFAIWLTVARVNLDLLYEEALARGMHRLRNECLEAPIFSGPDRAKFEIKNARLIFDVVKFLDERKRKNISLHLHGKLPDTARGAKGRFDKVVEVDAKHELPPCSSLDELTVEQLTKLEQEIDEQG